MTPGSVARPRHGGPRPGGAGGADAAFLCHEAYARCGTSVAARGDVDGDGLADLLIGGPGMLSVDPAVSAGRTWLLPGARVAAGGAYDLTSEGAVPAGG